MSRSRLMRVPESFYERVNHCTKKYGFKSNTKFLEMEGNKLLDNANTLSDFVGTLFKKRGRL
jgi:hypothetical protein